MNKLLRVSILWRVSTDYKLVEAIAKQKNQNLDYFCYVVILFDHKYSHMVKIFANGTAIIAQKKVIQAKSPGGVRIMKKWKSLLIY